MEESTGMKYKALPISDIRPGNYVVNLGLVLEIDDLGDVFSMVVMRLNRKEVIEFAKDVAILITID